VDGCAGGGPACWAATRLGERETKLGAILNTVQGSLVPDITYNVFGGTLNPAQFITDITVAINLDNRIK